MTWLPPRSSVRFVFVGAVVLAVLLGHLLIAAPRQIASAVGDSVDGFVCPAMRVHPSGGSWSWHSHYMRAALWMPRPCVADLQDRIRRSMWFRADRCNAVEQCWVRRRGGTTYSFTFYPSYVGFRYEAQ